MSYEFIEVLEKKPKVEKKRYRKETVAARIINEFTTSKAKYAKISFDKVKGEYSSPAFCARAMGRVMSTMDLSDQIEVYSDSSNIYLERKK